MSKTKNGINSESKLIKLDDLDKKILRLLQDDARLSLRQLATKTGTSTTAVKNHLEYLKRNEIILNYVTIIDCNKVGYKEALLFWIRVNTNVKIDKILDELKKIDKINAIYQISGASPIFCIAKCVSKDDEIELLEEIKDIEGVEEIITQVILRRIKEDMRVNI
ncbi:MAG: Lrp/AsnC family transcriptional regulator [Promethearchaeota archaeon]